MSNNRVISTKMSNTMMNQIKAMGFEQYIADVHSRYQLMGGLKVLGYALLFGAIAIAASFLLPHGDIGVEIPNGALIALMIVGINLILGGIVAYFVFFSPSKRKKGLVAYKEKLIKRHGDYHKVLKEVESQLDPSVHKTECSTYITEDWVIIMDARRPISFTHKSEIAALIGTSAGTVMVWDDGAFDPDMYFGNNTWWRVFDLIAQQNPYILTNRDSFENNQGQVVSIGTTTTHFARRSAENGKFVAKQFATNKQAGVLPVWHKKTD